MLSYAVAHRESELRRDYRFLGSAKILTTEIVLAPLITIAFGRRDSQSTPSATLGILHIIGKYPLRMQKPFETPYNARILCDSA